MISLLAGKPNAATFPFTSLSFTARDPRDPDGPERTVRLSDAHLAQGLQYGPTAGFPPFVAWLAGLQAREHRRAPAERWRVSVGIGSQDLLNKVCRAGSGECAGGR
jgi:tryptophan aminotransferase